MSETAGERTIYFYKDIFILYNGIILYCYMKLKLKC
jgi:hypothetical protein